MFKKKILPIIIFLILLLGMAYFPYIPMELFNINYDNFNMTMKSLYMFFCDIGYILILFILYKDKIIKDFKNYFKDFSKNFEQSFKYYFIGVLIMMISNLILTIFVSSATANNEEAVRAMIDQVPLYMLFSVSIYAPFVEELIFRHSIKDSIICYGNNKITKYIYIIISGFIFGFLHMSLDSTNYLDYLYIVPYMSLGVAFAALYHKSDNIFSSIVMHSLHNTVTVILYFITSGAIK